MRYFLYNDKNMDEYLKEYNENLDVLIEIDIMSDANMTRIRECVEKIGELEFKQMLIDNGLKIKDINFNNFTYTPLNSNVNLNLPKLSTGERVIFFVCMARILGFDFVGQGFITVLSMRNREKLWECLKGCKQGTIIANSFSEIPVDCKELGCGYYGY